MDRAEAWNLLCEYTKNENLRKHALAVEACVHAYARKFAEDEEKWSVVGLIHELTATMHWLVCQSGHMTLTLPEAGSFTSALLPLSRSCLTTRPTTSLTV